MHAIIPFDRFNTDDFSFCFGARPISPHEWGSIRALRLRYRPPPVRGRPIRSASYAIARPQHGGDQYASQATLSPAPHWGGRPIRSAALAMCSGLRPCAHTPEWHGYCRGAGNTPCICLSLSHSRLAGAPKKPRSQILPSNQWLGGAVCDALGERRTERSNLDYSHEILIWCGTCDDGLASRNVSTPSL